MKFNENLKYLRKESGLTQEGLAEKLNISRQAVAKWENGNAMPDAENLKEISYLFGVSIDQLLENKKGKSNAYFQNAINGLLLSLLYIIGWVMGMTILCIFSGIEASNPTIVKISIGSLFINTFLIGYYIKNYIDTRKIINMQNTEEGKKERRKLIIKDAIIILVILLIAQLPVFMVQNIEKIFAIGITIAAISLSLVSCLINYGVIHDGFIKHNKK